MALDLKHQTKSQFLDRLRVDYRSASGERAAKLAAYILALLADGSVADAEMRAAFGATVQDWARLKSTVLTPQANALASVRAARGE